MIIPEIILVLLIASGITVPGSNATSAFWSWRRNSSVLQSKFSLTDSLSLQFSAWKKKCGQFTGCALFFLFFVFVLFFFCD